MKQIIVIVAIAAIALGAGSLASASELDNEQSVTNQALNGTVVVRLDTRTQKAAVLATDVISSDSQAQAVARSGAFKPVSSAHVKSELDQTGGASSWYFYNGYHGYPTYNYGYNYGYLNWYGSWYQPRYTYSYSYYQYYYYSYYGW